MGTETVFTRRNTALLPLSKPVLIKQTSTRKFSDSRTDSAWSLPDISPCRSPMSRSLERVRTASLSDASPRGFPVSRSLERARTSSLIELPSSLPNSPLARRKQTLRRDSESASNSPRRSSIGFHGYPRRESASSCPGSPRRGSRLPSIYQITEGKKNINLSLMSNLGPYLYMKLYNTRNLAEAKRECACSQRSGSVACSIDSLTDSEDEAEQEPEINSAFMEGMSPESRLTYLSYAKENQRCT